MSQENGAQPVPLVVLTTAKAGGAERALTYLVGSLPRFGFEPTVLLLESGAIEQWLDAEDCDRVVVTAEGDDPSILAGGLVEELGAGLVLSSKWDAHVFGGRAARDANVPAIWWQHDAATDDPAELEAAELPVSTIVCASDLSLDAQRVQTPEATLVKIPYGIPVSKFSSRRGCGAVLRAERGWSDDPLVGIVGRLQEFKGQHVFLEAAAIIAGRREDVRFVVVGGATLGTEGDYPAQLESQVKELGLTERIHFVGHQEDVAPWFDALDVAVHATNGEPFGLVILEAMALGTPVVATNLGGPGEIIEDGLSGLLVPPGEPDPAARAVLRILDDSDLRAALSAAGARTARRFTVNRMGRRFASLLRSFGARPLPAG